MIENLLIVLYNGNTYHAPLDGFGDDKHNSRLALLIFISAFSIEVSV